ncbi:hypothetical protein GYA25_00430 [Candidatus Woesearchaeota archaeon]|nr:hypothetical protein [Candidatus Woesearchaeota archaeon]
MYKIKTKEGRVCFLISYFVGHVHLFQKGDIIKFKAPLFEFSKNLVKRESFVIPIQGSWVEID